MHRTLARERVRADVLCVGLDKLRGYSLDSHVHGVGWQLVHLPTWGHSHAPSLAFAHIEAALQYADANGVWQV